MLNNKWGVINKLGNEFIPIKYDEIGNSSRLPKFIAPFKFHKGLAAVRLNGKWGFVDMSGNEAIPIELEYDQVDLFDDGLAKVTKMDIDGGTFAIKYGFIDFLGKEVIPLAKYDNVDHFCEGIVKVESNDLYGLVNKNGVEVVPCIYDTILYFKDGLAKVKLSNKWGCIGESFKEIIPCKYNNIDGFKDGYARVELDGKYGYIHKDGNEIIPCKYDEIGKFKNGLAHTIIESHTDLKPHRKYGYINTLGAEVIPCIYDSVSLVNEIVYAKLDGETFYFHKSGESISSKYIEQERDKEEYEYDFRQDTWWALTDGQYGDMPENWDGDTDFLGY
jgi:hypothetical protein